MDGERKPQSSGTKIPQSLMHSLRGGLGSMIEGVDRVVHAISGSTEKPQDQPTNLGAQQSAGKRRVQPPQTEFISVNDHIVMAETLSRAPLIKSVLNIVTEAEAKRLVEATQTKLDRASVVEASGEVKISATRTNHVAAFTPGENDVIDLIAARLSKLIQLPSTHFETLQVFRYGPGQFFGAHYDWFDKDMLANEEVAEYQRAGGQRLWTLLTYLNDLPPSENGGGTEFPEVGLDVRPRVGTGVLWRNLDTHGEPDRRTLHAAIAPTHSVKYSCSIWVREKPIPEGLVRKTGMMS